MGCLFSREQFAHQPPTDKTTLIGAIGGPGQVGRYIPIERVQNWRSYVERWTEADPAAVKIEGALDLDAITGGYSIIDVSNQFVGCVLWIRKENRDPIIAFLHMRPHLTNAYITRLNLESLFREHA